ncbi:Retrovirus-related Pol polyprotein from transposon TNT 1-94 [Vitis vinifera]|uniref:Retrovirus-related Pol polyprotein from transposon TNT 1-94 n=1 Tax=Vitis vinifera TaxID=29760 RepID=A0A438F1D3_VITVI|nr:Retrovirus-related Pol polyprotein from transposon TNT 1-94 [Vitis vinifera]
MSTSSNTSSVIPVFNGEHYHIWAVKMRFYLRSQGLWNVVMSEADPPPLGANPTVAQMKAYEKKKLKKDKAITCLHSGLADHIFTKIMDLETPKQVWDKLQGEFEDSNRVKIVKLLTLKREFELMKMKDNKSVKDYSSRLMDVVNQMRLLATCDLQSLPIVELITKLHAKEQRVLMRGDEATEGAFQENHKEKSSRNLQGKKFFKNNKGKAEGSSRKENFLPCSHCNRTNHAEKDCWYKGKPPFNCNFAINLATMRSIAEPRKNNISSKHNNMQIGCTNHITKHLSIFTSIDRLVQPKVKLGNGEVVQAKGKRQLLSTPREIDESVVWHTRYGHFNLKSLKFMQKASIVEDMPEIIVKAQTCESCELRKQHRKSFPQNMSKRATHKLELVHSNICGPMSTASLSNNVYFALFIYDLSKMTWVYFLKTKSQVLSVFKSFKKMVETQSGQKVKVLRTDNGGEYTSKEFNVFCQEARYVHQLIAPYSPQQNGVSERKNRTVMEMARCMLFEKKLPKLLWAETVSTSVYLLNKLPTKSVQSKIPIKAWPDVIPSVKHLKVFGSLCYLHVPSIKRGKLNERAKKCVFVGYAAESRGYRIYSLSRMKIVISRDVHFDENSYWNWDLKKVHKCDQTTPSILEPVVESTSLEDSLDVEATLDTAMLKVRLLSDVYERCNLVHAEPTCYTEAAIGVKWVFRTKFNSDGSTFKHRARLVVKGFAQVVRVDYGDTFAPVARHDTIKLLLALAGQMGWKVYHLDVKSTFLNVSLYVDDMLVTGSNVRLLVEFKMEMQDVFEMSDLGIMNYFLGMEIYQFSLGIFISQRKYVVDILKEFKLESCKEVATLLAQNEKISKNDGAKLEEPSAYRSLIGSLLYLIATKPDLMFPASFLSRFMSSPSNVHMGVAKNVLKYVRGITNLGIWYLKIGGVNLDGYVNSDWAGSVDDMKNTSKLCIYNRFRCHLMEFKKARSQEQSSPIELYCDNKSAIAIAQNPVQHGKTKHMNVKFHSIREAENNSLVKLHYCSTDVQLVDIMTKALPKSRLVFLRLKLGMSKANLKEEC